MKKTYFIELHLKTCRGFERFGCFDIGDDREFAGKLFSQLKRAQAEGDAGILHMGLVEKYRDLPMEMRVISCSMEDLSENVKTITRELFKRLVLGHEVA